MRPIQIRAELQELGISLRSLARDTGMSQPTISRAINRGGRSAKVEAGIAKALGKPLHIVFPEYYPAPEGYQPPATVQVPATELAEIKASLVRATRTIERLCAAA
ncbi:MAG: helix-turn-helix domain-containing protein [Chroococcidiopsis sp.]